MAAKEGGPGFLMGVLAGGVLGFIAGILLAPKSGEETRAMLIERGSEWKDKAEELAADARERVVSATVEGRRVASRMRGDLDFDELDDEDL